MYVYLSSSRFHFELLATVAVCNSTDKAILSATTMESARIRARHSSGSGVSSILQPVNGVRFVFSCGASLPSCSTVLSELLTVRMACAVMLCGGKVGLPKTTPARTSVQCESSNVFIVCRRKRRHSGKKGSRCASFNT